MKKKAAIIVAIVLATVLASSTAGCKLNRPGDISKAEIILQSSERHSNADIMAAVRLVKEHFRTYFGNCTLKTLYYDDEKSLQEEAYGKSTFNGVEAIILYSDFHVGDVDADTAFNSNTEYDDWNWVVIKAKDGKWKLETWGY